MRPEEILLQVASGLGRSVFQFTCPACFAPVEKRADRATVALLVSAGVDIATRETLLGQPGAELQGPEPEPELLDPMDTPPDGRPFTLDDVVDFHFLLEDDAFIEDFFASQP